MQTLQIEPRRVGRTHSPLIVSLPYLTSIRGKACFESLSPVMTESYYLAIPSTYFTFPTSALRLLSASCDLFCSGSRAVRQSRLDSGVFNGRHPRRPGVWYKVPCSWLLAEGRYFGGSWKSTEARSRGARSLLQSASPIGWMGAGGLLQSRFPLNAYGFRRLP